MKFLKVLMAVFAVAYAEIVNVPKWDDDCRIFFDDENYKLKDVDGFNLQTNAALDEYIQKTTVTSK